MGFSVHAIIHENAFISCSHQASLALAFETADGVFANLAENIARGFSRLAFVNIDANLPACFRRFVDRNGLSEPRPAGAGLLAILFDVRRAHFIADQPFWGLCGGFQLWFRSEGRVFMACFRLGFLSRPPE